MKALEAICISPHSDDVALSLTETLNGLGERAADCLHLTLITCFSQSAYSPFHPGASADSVSAVRMSEDLDYLARLGVPSRSLRPLGQLDAPLRPEWPRDADIEDPAVYLATEADMALHVPRLADLLARQRRPGALYFAPLGLAHKDHVIVEAAAVAAFPGEGLIFYEDCPYNLLRPESEVAARAGAVAAQAGTTLVPMRPAHPFRLDRWLTCLGAYRSQFRNEELVAIGAGLKNRGGETSWVTPKARRLLRSRGLLATFERA